MFMRSPVLAARPTPSLTPLVPLVLTPLVPLVLTPLVPLVLTPLVLALPVLFRSRSRRPVA